MLSNWRIGDVVRAPSGRVAVVKEFRTDSDNVKRMRIVYKDLARDETWVPVHLPRMVLDNKRG